MKTHEVQTIFMPLETQRLKIQVSEVIHFLMKNHDFIMPNDANLGMSTFGRKLKFNDEFSDTFNPQIENRIEITLPIQIDPNTARLLRYKKLKLQLNENLKNNQKPK